MSDEPDYVVDISSLKESESAGSQAEASGSPRALRWIGIFFECCSVYSRIYRNREGTAYMGFCPRCQRPAKVKVGAGGTNARLFRAT